ncbi:MAG: helix-turn-helix domain-containing protein [Synechococcus sp.]
MVFSAMASRESLSSDPQNDSTQETITELQHVGQVLQHAREAQGLSVQQLAKALHMGDEQLQALERGDRDHLAESVFVRASVRRVANKLRLDPEPLIAALQSLDPAQGAQRFNRRSQAFGSPTRTHRPAAMHKRGWIRVATATTAVVAALAAGLSLGQSTMFFQSLLFQADNSALAPSATTAPDASKFIRPAPTSSGAPQTVTILTSKPSWIALRNQNGELLFEGLVTQEKTVSTHEGLEIYAGRPDLVSVTRDGQQQRPLGAIDQLRWYRISAAPAPPDPNL